MARHQKQPKWPERKDPFLDDRPKSVEEVAAYLGCTEEFVRQQIRAGKLRATRLTSRFIRIQTRDIQEWLESGVTIPRPEKRDRKLNSQA